MKHLVTAIALAISASALAQGQIGPNEPGYTIPKTSDSGRPRLTESGRSFRGEVKAVDKVAGTVTLRHDSISALGVPAGTSDYPVKNGAALETIKAGDHVRFTAVLQGRSLLVTDIAPAN